MHFTLDHYSELVTRTRIGDSQVSGTMEQALRDGIDLFRITSHNTTSAQCIPHEGQFYTTNPKLIGKLFQGKKIGEASRANLPLYHPGNCLHRVVAVPYLDDEITGAADNAANVEKPVVNSQGQLDIPTSGPKPLQNQNLISDSGNIAPQQTQQPSINLQDLINNKNIQNTRESRRAAKVASARNQFNLIGQDVEQAQAGIDSGSIAPFSFDNLTRSNKSLYDGIARIVQAKIDDARTLLEKQMPPDAANKALIPIIKKLSSEKYIRIKNNSGQWVYLTLKEARAIGLKF